MLPPLPLLLLLPAVTLALPPPVHAEGTPEPGWKEYVGKGYTCSGTEFRGEVSNENGTAAGCAAAAQAMPDCAGVNYATWRTEDPSVCYTCRIVPGNTPGAAAKLVEAASMTSLVGSLPPVPPACPKTFREPAFVRHFNFSVVPKRCGHIDMEPLLPPEWSSQDVSDYLQITLDAMGVSGMVPEYLSDCGQNRFSCECGKSYADHRCTWLSGRLKCGPGGGMPVNDSRAARFTKRNDPPTLPTPWVTAGHGGEDPRPCPICKVDTLFAEECLSNCKCALHPAASGDAATPLAGAPPCLDSALKGMCKVCGQKFNDNLAQSVVQLFCDPNDPNCAP